MMKRKHGFFIGGIIVLILSLTVSDIAFGKPVEISPNIQIDNWFWNWRQPPYIIVYGYQGYPYVAPYSEIVIWGETNSNALFSVTVDHEEISPYPKGFYRSVDEGLTWEHLPFDFDDTIIQSLIVHPDTPTIMLAGSDNSHLPGGIYRSSNGGDTWENVLADRVVYDIEVDPVNTNRIYASTCCWGGVFRSEDYGQTWDQISEQAIQDIEVHPKQPNVLFGARIFSTNPEEGIYRSDNAGETWTQIANIGGQLKIIIDADHPNRMFAFGRGYGGIWRTENGGESWDDLSSGLPYFFAPPTVLSATIDHSNDSLWVGLKYGGMIVSHDYGNSWTEVNNGIPFFGGANFGPQCTSIAISSNGKFAISCSGRVYVRTRMETIFLPLISHQ